MHLKLIKENEKGRVYQGNGFKVVYRNKGAISGNNAENAHEFLYFITGAAEVTIENKTEMIEAPAKIEIPAKTYHKIIPQTDVSCILFETAVK
jgi:mannose-6-phosphate isomerase-like protein (cupin superfamily)